MNNRSVDLLNELLELCREGERFYRDAAVKAGSFALRGTFRQMADLRQRLMDDLADEIHARGEQPSDRRTVLGASRQLFADALAALTLHDDDAYIAELERLEERLLRRYDQAIEAAVSDGVRHVLQRHRITVRAAHERMKALRAQSLAA
jgi:uncharacterized protein (TIGR02284 family)